jgi:hypothetical protein
MYAAWNSVGTSVRKSVGNMRRKTSSIARKVGKSMAPFIGAAKAATQAAAASQAENSKLARQLQHAKERALQAEDRASLAERQVIALDKAVDDLKVVIADQAAKSGSMITYDTSTGVMDVQPCSADTALYHMTEYVKDKTGGVDLKSCDGFAGSVVVINPDNSVWWSAFYCGSVFITADSFGPKGYTRFCVNPIVFGE